MPRNLHLFCDETGQETRGEFFLVAACMVPSPDLEDVRAVICQLEVRSGKRHRWARTTRDRRRLFLEGLPPVLGLLERACWKSFAPARDYPALVADVAAETASRSAPYDSLVVVVDGGSIAEFVPIKHALRARALGWRKVLGARDQAEPLSDWRTPSPASFGTSWRVISWQWLPGQRSRAS